jgi:abortive infection bacteriophage resistance protein
VYFFDRRLRLLVLDAIERIEVSIRAQIVNFLALKYHNSHWQDDPVLFKPPYLLPNGAVVDIFKEIGDIITKQQTSRHPEVFIRYYHEKYNDPVNPPVWMCLELLTIGELSRLYKGLRAKQDRQGIANFFGLHDRVFTSWMHAISYLRNLCAHHSRIWNREFAIKPDVLLKPSNPWVPIVYNSNNHRCFYFLCVLKYLLNSAHPGNHFSNRLSGLLNAFPEVPIQYLGIPSDCSGKLIDWQKEPLWSGKAG